LYNPSTEDVQLIRDEKGKLMKDVWLNCRKIL